MNYNELMENANLIAKIYSDKEVLDMSKDLSFEDRMKFNYKIKCIKNDTSYQETFVSFCHRKDFIKKLVCNDELDYIVNNFNKIIQRSADLVNTPLSYLKRNENKINREDLDKIEERIANCTSIYYPNNKEEDRARLKDVLIIDLDHIYKDDDEYNIERIREKQSELRRSTIEKLENRYNEETNKGITLKKAMYDYPEYY